MRKVKLATLIFAVLIFFAGCSGKQDEIYNKPAEFWYEQIIYDIKDSDLEAADKHFASMSAEHVSSPLVEQAMMILAQAHAQVEEYILANFYFDEYIKRYSDGSRMEYIKYLKIKANFDSFAQPARNQQLLLDTIEETKVFLQEYPDSI